MSVIFLLNLIIFSPGLFHQEVNFPQSAVLTPTLIDQAIAWGKSDSPIEPFRLRSELGAPSNQKIAVYTPFIRVALAARSSRDNRKEQFDVWSLPDWITAPSVLVVFGRPCPDAPPCHSGNTALDTAAGAARIGIAPSPHSAAAVSRQGIVAPTSILTDLSMLGLIGGLPFRDAFVGAMFEPQKMRPGLAVFAAWTLPDRSLVFSGGQLTDADLRSWR